MAGVVKQLASVFGNDGGMRTPPFWCDRKPNRWWEMTHDAPLGAILRQVHRPFPSPIPSSWHCGKKKGLVFS